MTTVLERAAARPPRPRPRRGLWLGVAVVSLGAALWMLNDIRLQVRRSSQTIQEAGPALRIRRIVPPYSSQPKTNIAGVVNAIDSSGSRPVAVHME